MYHDSIFLCNNQGAFSDVVGAFVLSNCQGDVERVLLVKR